MRILWYMAVFMIPCFVGCNSDVVGPTGLMTEFIREPTLVKIVDKKPEFSWIVPEDAIVQTAWQIQVASTKERLISDNPDFWDSGKNFGNRSTEVEYQGTELNDKTDYYWRVRIWDKLGKRTNYSVVQHIRTGVFGEYRTTNNSFQSVLRKPVFSKKLSETHYFYDFGKDAFATLELHVQVEKKDSLIIHLGEKTSDKYEVDRNPGGSIRYKKIVLEVSPGQSEYRLELPPNSRNTGGKAILLPDSIGVILPFRYCEIENSPVELDAENVLQKAYWHYFDDGESYFSCSDTILNKIWEICKYSMKATSFTGFYIDGDRERIPYEGDAYINQLGHYSTDREYSMARRTNEYFMQHPTWPTEWILHTVPMFYADYLYTGNLESIIHNYENLKYKTLSFLSREDGLISVYTDKLTPDFMRKIGFSNSNEKLRDLVDWPPGQKDTGWKLARPEGERDGYDMVEVNTVVNAFFYWNLLLMKDIAGLIHEKEDSVFFDQLLGKVKASINEVLFDRKKGIYVDGEGATNSSLHANMLPLAVGLVPEQYKQSVVDFIKSRGMACSVYGAQYLMEGLFKAGEASYAYSLLTATNDRSWWNMIRSGSTISMEAWDMKYKPNSDWNHAWGAVPANIIPRYIWGIQPVEPGFAETKIQPYMNNLTLSEIKFPTIRGPIHAKYELKLGNNHIYELRIPGNMIADFALPTENWGDLEVHVNGKRIALTENSIPLKSGWNTIEFQME